MTENEQVLVVPTNVVALYADLFRDRACVTTQTNVPYTDEFLGELMKNAFFMDRGAAEVDDSFVQLIPYCVLMDRPDGGNELEVFSYKRTKKGGEGRLHDKYSIGVGGHINPIDDDGNGTYEAALKRELKEEVGLDYTEVSGDGFGLGLYDFAPLLGFIYDPSNEVGKVHLGLVHKVMLVYGKDRSMLKFDDPALAGGQWLTRGAAMNLNVGDLENWSRIALTRFADKLFDMW